MPDDSSFESLQLAANIQKMMGELHSNNSRALREACEKEKNKLSSIWAKIYGVKPSRGKGDWWGRLIKNVASHSARKLGLPEQLPNDDHASLWIKDGKPHFWVSQPYNLNLREMVEAAEQHGLGFKIDTFPSWYNPSHTHLVVWTRLPKAAGS